MVYIAILRGINVGGHRKLPMAALRALLTNLGYENVQTYIQSGNVIFISEEQDQKKIATSITKTIKETYDYDVPVLVKTIAQWKKAIQNNPFTIDDITKYSITFLSETPPNVEIDINSKDDRFVIIDTEIYLHCPNGFGRSKLDNSLFERKLNVQATNRNLKTVQKLLVLAETLKTL